MSNKTKVVATVSVLGLLSWLGHALLIANHFSEKSTPVEQTTIVVTDSAAGRKDTLPLDQYRPNQR